MSIDIFALPMHPAFVHFPVAMLSAAWACIVLGYATGASPWQRLATNVEWIGILFLPVTILTGVADTDGLGSLLQPDWSQPLIWHVLISLGAGALFTVHAVWRNRAGTAASRLVPDLGLATIAFVLLVMSGLLAGELVYG